MSARPLPRTALAFIAAIALASVAQAQDEVAPAGAASVPTPAEAPGAIEVASRFVSAAFERKMTVATVVASAGDWADVEAWPFPKMTCSLKMRRAPLNSVDGWTVQTFTCKTTKEAAPTP